MCDEPFIGEICMVGFNFAPEGWHLCDGSLLNIAQNQALFSLLGVTYGGDGRTTFALPNLCGRVPIDVGPGFAQGQAGGKATHTLTMAELPAHAHPATATTTLKGSSNAGDSDNPQNTVPANTNHVNIYQTGAANVNRAAAATTEVAVANTGGGQPHNNLPPYLAVYFIIATTGIYPPRP